PDITSTSMDDSCSYALMLKLVPSTVVTTSDVLMENGCFSSRATTKNASPLRDTLREPLAKSPGNSTVLLGYNQMSDPSGRCMRRMVGSEFAMRFESSAASVSRSEGKK